MLHHHKLFNIVVLCVAILLGCAGDCLAEVSASDEMKEGYRAARRGYWQEALMRFERANELEPNQVRILNNLAVALEAVGRFEEAKEVYAQALAIDPGDSKLKKNHRLAKEFYEANIAKKEPPKNEDADAAAEGEQDTPAETAEEGGDDA